MKKRNPLLVVVGFLRRATAIFLDRAEAAYWEAKVSKKAQSCVSVRINGPGVIHGLSSLRIGSNVHVGRNYFWMCDGGLDIGDNVHFSRSVTIYTRSHNYEGSRLPYDETHRFRPVRIERNVWIGMNVTILPGATIGRGAIIGAGAVVAGNIPEMAIVGAVVGQKIKSRSREHYEYLEMQAAYGGSDGRPL